MSALNGKFLETGSPVPKIAAYSAAERKDGRVPTLCFRTKPYIVCLHCGEQVSITDLIRKQHLVFRGFGG